MKKTLILESSDKDLRDKAWKRIDFKVTNDLVEINHLDKSTGKKYFSVTRLGATDVFGNPSILYQEIYLVEDSEQWKS